MMVSIARSDGDVRLIRSPKARPGVLVHHVHLGNGVHVDVDLMRPEWWHAVSYPSVDDSAGPLMRALVGARAAGALPAGGGRVLDIDPAGVRPWLRVALVDALDRWLQVPLDQSLIDAERGVSRGCAAKSLPEGTVRELVMGDALRLTRRASRDLAALLRRLARQAQPVPRRLVVALEHLVDGYRALAHEVVGRDRELSAVLDGWRRFLSAAEAERRAPDRRWSADVSRPSAPLRPTPGADSMIDPRQVPARVFALSADPGSAEVTLSKPAPSEADAVLVRVPAFRRGVDPDVMSRLLVRLVHWGSAQSRGHAPLTLATGRAGRDGAPVFEATVPLCGLNASEVRADVFDVLSDLPPAGADAESALQDARRAVVFFGEWRRVVALAQLAAPAFAPTRRLRELAALLQPGDDPRAGEPLFTGGPTGAELQALVDVGDDELLSRLRDEQNPIGDGPLALTRGAAGLLVAEIAAAYAA